jgi:hypothetical protein
MQPGAASKRRLFGMVCVAGRSAATESGRLLLGAPARAERVVRRGRLPCGQLLFRPASTAARHRCRRLGLLAAQDVGEIDAGACQQRMGALRRFELLCTPVPLDGFVEIAAAGGETRPEPGDRTTKVDACIEEELSVERLEDRVELGRFVPATETSSEFGERADRSGLGPVAPE